MIRYYCLTVLAIGLMLAAEAGTVVSLHGLAPYANTVADDFWTTTGRVCVNVSQESGTAVAELDCRTRATAASTSADAVEGRVKVVAMSNAIVLRTSAPGTLLLCR